MGISIKSGNSGDVRRPSVEVDGAAQKSARKARHQQTAQGSGPSDRYEGSPRDGDHLKELTRSGGPAAPASMRSAYPGVSSTASVSHDEVKAALLKEGWLPLSDVVAFFETVKTHRLEDISARYDEIAHHGFDAHEIDDILHHRFDVKTAQLEHDIGHQNSNPNRSVTELTSNAVDAYNGDQGDVRVAVEDGRYVVEDHGKGMNAQAVFERLLIPQLSGKTGATTIGRFGIGFFTALAHLKDENSRVVVETKVDGQKGIRLEFCRLNGELGVRVGPSRKRTHGTRIEVIDARIRKDTMQRELSENMGFVLTRRITANGAPINGLEPHHVTNVGDGRLYVSPAVGAQGRAIITVGGVKIEEFQLSGKSIPELMVFDFPLSTKLPESRNQIRVDTTVVAQVKALIDHADHIEDKEARQSYLNGIAPMVRALQKLNEAIDAASDLTEYARAKAASHLQGARLVPNDPMYDVIADSDVVRVDDLYVERNWAEKFTQPAEWQGSDRLILVDMNGAAKSGVIHDKERGVVLLDRRLYESHKKDPAGVEVLSKLPPGEVRGTWRWNAGHVSDHHENQVRGVERTQASSGSSRSTRVSQDIAQRVDAVTAQHPILMSQRSALEALAETYPDALHVLQQLQGVFVRFPKMGIRIHGEGADRVFVVTETNRIIRVVRTDGTRVLPGLYSHIEINGSGANRVYTLKENTTWRVVRADGTQVLQGELIRTYDNADDPIFMVVGENGRERVVRGDETPILHGEYIGVNVYGKGTDTENFRIVVA